MMSWWEYELVIRSDKQSRIIVQRWSNEIFYFITIRICFVFFEKIKPKKEFQNIASSFGCENFLNRFYFGYLINILIWPETQLPTCFVRPIRLDNTFFHTYEIIRFSYLKHEKFSCRTRENLDRISRFLIS